MSGLFNLPMVVADPDEELGSDLEPGASSLDLLQSVYRDVRQPMTRRLRAAIAALPFEHPKLAVVAQFKPGEGFAAKLEAAIARGQELRTVVIEGDPAQPGLDNRAKP